MDLDQLEEYINNRPSHREWILAKEPSTTDFTKWSECKSFLKEVKRFVIQTREQGVLSHLHCQGRPSFCAGCLHFSRYEDFHNYAKQIANLPGQHRHTIYSEMYQELWFLVDRLADLKINGAFHDCTYPNVEECMSCQSNGEEYAHFRHRLTSLTEYIATFSGQDELIE